MSDLLCDDNLTRSDVEILNAVPGVSAVNLDALLHQVNGADRLNGSQRAAVAATIKRVITLIQGPPGTGKTSTSMAILAVHAQKANLVGVTAPSNHAVDELMKRLCGCDSIPLSILRLGRNTST